MHGHIASVDPRPYRRGIFEDIAASGEKLLVDRADMVPPGVISLHSVCDLQQLFNRGIKIGERPFLANFIG
jgi:hypothetical protein